MALQGHTDIVNSICYFQGQRDSVSISRIASGSKDHTVRVWDAETGVCVHTLRHTGEVNSVSFSPDGKRIASGSYDHTVRVWDTETGVCLKTLVHRNAVFSVSFSPDGALIASGAFDKTVRLWDVGREAIICTAKAGTRGVKSVSYSPDGARIVSGHLDGVVRVWSRASGARELKCVHTLDENPPPNPKGKKDLRRIQVWSVSFSPDGKRIVSGAQTGKVRVWNADSGVLMKTLLCKTEGVLRDVNSVSFSPDGAHIVSGSNDGIVRVWDAETWACLHTLNGHTEAVMSVSFTPDGKRIVSGSRDKTVRVWDVEHKELVVFQTNTNKVPKGQGNLRLRF